MIYSGNPDLTDLAEIVAAAVGSIRPVCNAFDYIAVTGMSGVMVGAPIAVQIDKPIVLVRKDSDKSHSSRAISGDARGKYLFVDDFISTGATVRRLIDALAPEGGIMVGGYFYHHEMSSYPELTMEPYYYAQDAERRAKTPKNANSFGSCSCVLCRS